jgi:hypothetical protein
MRVRFWSIVVHCWSDATDGMERTNQKLAAKYMIGHSFNTLDDFGAELLNLLALFSFSVFRQLVPDPRTRST